MIRRDRYLFALCAVAVLVAVLAIGGATRWAQAAVAAIVAVLIGATLTSRRVFERPAPLVVLLLAASAVTLVQLLPLPAGIAASLTPTLNALRDEGANLAGVSPASTLSMDPSATLRALIYLVVLTGVAVGALRLAISESGRYLLVVCVAATAGIAALIAGIHEIAGATRLYGVYTPRQLPPILGPLLNTNHLGGLMAIGALTSLGLAFYKKQSTVRRAIWLLVTLGCILVAAATYSRGAIIGLGAGLAVFVATLIAQRFHAAELSSSRRKREKLLATTLPIGVIVVCMLFLAVYLGGSTVMSQLEHTSLDELQAPRTKYAAWISSFQLLEEAPWVGVGRGAFESAFTRVHAASAYATFSHPENEFVQAVVEWGIPATLGLALLAGWTLLLALRRWKDGPLAAGALGALMAIGFQSNFDFGMELFGQAIPMVVLVGTLTYVPIVETSVARVRRARALRAIHAAALAAGAISLLTSATRTIEEDHLLLQRHPEPVTILASIEAHPLDYLGYAELAQQKFRAGDADAVRLLNHALRLHPTHADLHWIAARLLVRAKHLSQAQAEYTMAVRYSSNPSGVIAELVKVLPAERAAGAIPLDMPLEPTLRFLKLDIAARWLERVIEHTNDIRAAELLYSLGRRTKDWKMAATGARHRCRLLPSARCKLELASVLQLAGKPEEVIKVLSDVSDWQIRRDDQVQAWLMLCESYTAAGRADDSAECMRRLDASGARSTQP